ncbi:ATP-binding protein [uncultured Erythrobacter sp.]|uniref:ATP-binding protein n=1 Tax=uncultured Erythrobacter sp. TaxID=263913 RepID=UPI00263273D5|nr:ATP-binding protein [uncultured Erythrobacter sp.]
MNAPHSPNKANSDLVAELGRISAHLTQYAEGSLGVAHEARGGAGAGVDENCPLGVLKRIFALTDFEGDVLLLAAASELDAECASIIARLQNGGAASFSLALAALPDAHWSALLPDAPLRRWGLVHLSSTASIPRAELRIDERILHFMLGLDCCDPALRALFEPLEDGLEIPSSLEPVKRRIQQNWAQVDTFDGRPDNLLLWGPDREVARALCHAAASQAGYGAIEVRLADLPAAPEELRSTMRLLKREALLTSSWVALDCGALDPEGTARLDTVLTAAQLPLLITARTPPHSDLRATMIEVPRMCAAERLSMWQKLLRDDGEPGDNMRRLAFQFRLTIGEMRAALCDARACSGEAGNVDRALWDACRVQARLAMPPTIERRDASLDWDALILPSRETEVLQSIAAQMRSRARVHEEWQMGKASAQGNGIAALFAGPSGTGKTLAAEVLASAVGLDLYRVDLSQVISKYIGETEKNLRHIFDAAERGGAALLFDEADALFGKRSDVKSSHDRNANMEVSYLLQRIESYGGLAILTSNLKDNLDEAFLRRLRFVVEFPHPQPSGRKAIWKRMLRDPTPCGAIDFDRLAKLNLAGGSIRNIALNAAFIAADQNRAVEMDDLRAASADEYAKLERVFGDEEWESGNGR